MIIHDKFIYIHVMKTGGTSIHNAFLRRHGLDCFRDTTPLDQQVRSLRAHLALARELDRPVIFHCRDAFAPLSQACQRRESRLLVRRPPLNKRERCGRLRMQ